MKQVCMSEDSGKVDRVTKLEKCRERASLIVEIVNKGGLDYGILHYIWIHGIQMALLSW